MAELVVCARENDRLSGTFRKQVEAKQREYFAIAVDLFHYTLHLFPFVPGHLHPQCRHLNGRYPERARA